MIDPAGGSAEGTTPLPDLILYTRHGCHLCEDAREILNQLIDERETEGKRAPRFVERDITTHHDWLRLYSDTIPVVELGDARLHLATNPSRLRRLLAEVLDTEAASSQA